MNVIIESGKEVILRNGKIIKPDDDDNFISCQELDKKIKNPCDICPIYEVCQGNNSFDCDVYGIFSGGNFTLQDLIDVCNELKELRNKLSTSPRTELK